MIFAVPICAVYAQDCSDRIQAAGRLYEKYKKNYDKKTYDEARKQLKNITASPGVPAKCKAEAERLLKEWKPVYKPSASKSNVDVTKIMVRVDTVVERHVSIDTVVNIVFHHDSLKANRFYASESAALECAQRKEYECAIDNYQTAIAYGRELQLSEDILTTFQNKVTRYKQMQFNDLLQKAQDMEDKGNVSEALKMYQAVKSYGQENHLLSDEMAAAFEEKTNYLEYASQMFDFVKQADEYYQNREWEMAKQELETALEIADTLGWKKGRVYWMHRMDTINRILGAANTLFDYEMLNAQDYDRMNGYLATAIHNTLLRFREIPSDTMTVEITVDADGKRTTDIRMLREDSVFLKTVTEAVEKIPFKLPAVKYYGEPALAKATYNYTISVHSEIAEVKRTPKRGYKENPMLIGLDQAAAFVQKTGDTVKKIEFTENCKDYLFGKFYFNQAVAQVNNDSRSGFDLVKYRGSGGPANVFLSMIIPGLGRHRVTYGEKNGVATAIFFYLSAGISLGAYGLAFDPKIPNQKYTFGNYTADLKNFFKVKQNWSYLEQLALNNDSEGFPNGVDSRRTMYITSLTFAGIAAVIYVSDVLYTLIRGSVNVAKQNKYKKWSIGVFYEPNSKTPVLQYNYKIK